MSVHLDIMIFSMQDWCMVCAEHATGSEIILGAPDETPRWRGSSTSSFLSVWRLLISVQDRCMDWHEYTIGSEIILGTSLYSYVMWVK
jgi:hypothetical protein